VVGVGASAGGLEAFSQVLKHLPEKTGFAFVFIQHLDPKHPSLLTEILGRATKMPVHEAADGMVVEPDRVYVIPPNMDMRVGGGALHLSPRPENSGPHLPVDEFFRSLAAECKDRAVGVVLSGNASDGTLGLKEIKGMGGITFAQEEGTARYGGMPRSAVASGCVDLVLTPDKIAGELVRISQHPYGLPRAPETSPLPADGLKRIFMLVRAATGVDFSQYKQTTINRRIQRRMILLRIDRHEDYAEYLQKNPPEIDNLYQEALIHVTSFFREPETFEALAKSVFPALEKSRRAGDPFRVWLPGCSTGEEAYSLAISLVEFYEGNPELPQIQIFGTDVSDKVVNQARKGVFDTNIQADVSPGRLQRFFTKVDSGWQINKPIRDMCVFARQNVVKDPPFSKLDLVSCRNVLIYFDQALQKKLIPLFHYALREDGFLLLGSAESVGQFGELFEMVDQKVKIFKKRPAPRTLVFDSGAEMPPHPEPHAQPPEEKEVWSRLDVQKEADRVLMARFCPPAILFGENLEIIQFRGRVAPFIDPASGDASLNLFRMLRPEIEIELRAAINRVKKTGAPFRKENVRLNANGRGRILNIEVTPLVSPALRENCFIVIFEDAAAEPEPPAKTAAGSKSGNGRIPQLEQELAASKEHLQSILEEHEATNEELRSANEEIQASNEELQSTNEELETAREELQSINEELTTVNEELKHSNQNLGSVNNDIGNLLRSVNIPIVMLGRDLCIRSFTPVAQKTMRLLPADIGRPISDLRTDIEMPGLEGIVREVIETLRTHESEVRDSEGRWYSLVVRAYETTDNKITGAVIILFDIDARKRSTEQSELAKAYAEAFLDTVRNILLLLDSEGRVKRATESFYKTFGVTPAQTEGHILYELGNGQWNIPALRSLLEEILPKNTRVHEFRVEHDFPLIGRKRMLLNARRLERDIDGKPLILLSIEQTAAGAEG
jgi:two-component system CheB/CheR fusion protein